MQTTFEIAKLFHFHTYETKRKLCLNFFVSFFQNLELSHQYLCLFFPEVYLYPERKDWKHSCSTVGSFNWVISDLSKGWHYLLLGINICGYDKLSVPSYWEKSTRSLYRLINFWYTREQRHFQVFSYQSSCLSSSRNIILMVVDITKIILRLSNFGLSCPEW